MNIYSFSILNFSFGVLLTAILALVKQKDHVSVRFCLFDLSVCWWGFIFAFWISQNYSYQTTLILARVTYISVVILPVAWIDFCYAYTDKKEMFKYFLLINYIFAFILLLLLPTPLLIQDLHPMMEFKYVIKPGILHHAHMVQFSVLVIYGFCLLIIQAVHSSGQRHTRDKFLIAGTATGFLGGTTIYMVFYGIPIPWVLLPVMMLYPILTGIAMIRYGLFDPEQIADAFQREKLTAIGMIATSLNHELRNPLYIAKGRIESHLDAVQRGLYSKEEVRSCAGDEALKISLRQLNRAMEIVQRFSDFAKPIEAKNFKDHVNIAHVVDEVLHMVSNEFKMQKIQLVKEIPENLFLKVNRRQFEEIIFNLVVNACHAMAEIGGTLTIKAKNCVIPAKIGIRKLVDPRNNPEDDKRAIVIQISDTGPGISKDNLNRIFEPFFTTKIGKGTGLGLYIVKQLIAKNNGMITVTSKMKIGTEFDLSFNQKL